MVTNGTTSHGNTLAHTYGIVSTLCGVIGLFLTLLSGKSAYQWLLVASGWVVASFLAWFLIRTSDKLTRIIDAHDSRTHDDARRIGQLEERVVDLQQEIDRRLATMDYLSSRLIASPALPRRASTQDPATPE